jgi:hypothetical protein
MTVHWKLTWTVAICPFFARSIQLASYNLGPIRYPRSPILSSSRTRVANRSAFSPLAARHLQLTSQTKLCVDSEPIDTFSERVGGHDVDLVKEQETPFSRSNPLHYFFSVVRPFPGDTDHRVGRDDDTSRTGKLRIS